MVCSTMIHEYIYIFLGVFQILFVYNVSKLFIYLFFFLILLSLVLVPRFVNIIFLSLFQILSIYHISISYYYLLSMFFKH